MDEAGRLLALLALAGAAFTVLGGAFAWFLDETRRVRRTLTHTLGSVPDPVLHARGRGVGVGFDLNAGRVAVTWDKGAWTLTYGLAELMGVELIVDRAVAARAFRGEARRPLDHLADPLELIRLRLVFDDPGHPDFQVDLWRPEDEGQRGRRGAGEALQEANRWMARIEALLRRTPPSPPAVGRGAPVVRPALPPVAPAAPIADEAFEDDDDDEDDPPWDDGSTPVTAIT